MSLAIFAKMELIKRVFLSVIGVFLAVGVAHPRDRRTASDSVVVNLIDSSTVGETTIVQPSIFDSLESRTNGKWFASTIYRALVRTNNTDLYANDPHAMVSAEERFVGYNGRVVRKIYLLKESIGSGGLSDTSQRGIYSTYAQLGRLHINTQSWRLKQQLHVSEGDTVDALAIADDERLLRSLYYISSAQIYLEPTFSRDSIDIIIVTKDAFPINTELEMADIGRYSTTVVHRNILGLGMQISGKYYYDVPESPPAGFGLAFANYNVWRTHSSFFLSTVQTAYRKNMSVKLQKPFQTQQTRFGGAAEYSESWEMVALSEDTLAKTIPVSNTYKNMWAGFSVPLRFRLANSFVFSWRIFEKDVMLRPEVTPHSYYVYHDKTMWLQSLQFRNIRYFNTGYVKAQGVIEDVPYGQMAELLAGYESAEFFSRPYVAARVMVARYNVFRGYYAFRLAGGSFLGENQRFEQAILSTDHEYFSNLHSFGSFHYRQFVSLSASYGMRRFPEESILAKETLPGLSSRYLRPFQSKVALHLESFLFAPWHPAQFRFAFSLHADIAAVSSSQNMIEDYVPLTGIGAGVRIRNERLFIQNLAIRANYYFQSDLYGQHLGGTISTSSPQRYNTMQPGQPETIPLR